MTDLQTALCLIFILVVSNEPLTALANGSCQLVSPSEYAYLRNSVYRNERSSANCRPYASGLEPHVYTENYHHCDGSQLRLTDSKLGSEQYNSSDYYVWDAGSSDSQLLFIFPTRVNLTTIRLHYYSGDHRGLPGLRFHVVLDDFDVWGAPTASYSVDIAGVAPDGEPFGRMNVSKSFIYTAKKLLMVKLSSSYAFALSEVEFFTCNANSITTTPHTMLQMSYSGTTVYSEKGLTLDTSKSPYTTTSITITASTETSTATTPTDSELNLNVIGVVITFSILFLLTTIATLGLIIFLRKLAQRKTDHGDKDNSYSTLCRESGQQMQSQLLHISDDLYDQIQLSPSTGQAEFISRNETANTNNSPPHQTEYGIHPSVVKDKPKSAKLKITASTISSQDEYKSTSEQPTYAVVNKKKKQKTENESVNCQSKGIAEVSQNKGVTEQNAVEHGSHDQEIQESPDTTMQFSSQTIDSPQELYTAVKKSPKDILVDDEIAPPIPPYTTEELYTAVKKKPQASTAGDEQAPQIPPHTIEELYTAVQKKPKASATDDEEEAPPVPAHTVEELYTAVVKKPKVSTAENEEEAPPIPPYTVEEL